MLKKVVAVLLIGVIAITSGCNSKKTELPEDYSFSLTWGVNGISSYDSNTGKLVKTSHATNPEDYITTHVLTEDESDEIKTLLEGLDLYVYPKEYDPFNAPNSEKHIMSCPSQNIILTVNIDGKMIEIKAIDISLSGESAGYNSDARAFLKTVYRIEEILQDTDEWKALPEYEFLYD